MISVWSYHDVKYYPYRWLVVYGMLLSQNECSFHHEREAQSSCIGLFASSRLKRPLLSICDDVISDRNSNKIDIKHLYLAIIECFQWRWVALHLSASSQPRTHAVYPNNK